MGVVLAGLILLLIMVFLIARKRRNDLANKHRQLLDDGYDDSVFLKDDYDGSAYRSPHPSPSRKNHLNSPGDTGSITSARSSRSGSFRGNSRSPDPFDAVQVLSDLQQQQWRSSARNVQFDLGHTDVHKCQSGTCEACNSYDRKGVQFVPARMPSHSNSFSMGSLPSNASRDYLASDTVDL